MGKSNIDKICFSKTRYSTKEEANKTADYIYETENVMLYVYRCPICNGFHLTKKKGKL